MTARDIKCSLMRFKEGGMPKTRRRQVTIRMDAQLFAAVKEHRDKMQASAPEAIVVPLRAAIESLIRAGARADEQRGGA